MASPRSPIRRIEAVSLVDKRRSPLALATEDDLPAIGIRSPTIKHENAGKILKVFDLLKQGVGQVVEHRAVSWIFT